MSPLDAAIAFCGVFEGELLLDLMLKYWQHPLHADPEFRNETLETAAAVLTRSKAGETLIEELPPDKMNFVAAVWYAEWSQVQDRQSAEVESRCVWLDAVRRAIPSCFCNPDDLP